MKKQFLEIGKIVSTHGVKGEVRVQPWCDDAAQLTEFEHLYFSKGEIEVDVLSARVNNTVVIMKIKGVDDMNAAQLLRNKILYINRDEMQLSDSTYFVQDLIGMTVVDADAADKVYGELIEVTQTGANDVYHIKQADEKVILIPAIPDVVIVTDVDNQRMTIRPLKGLFDDEV